MNDMNDVIKELVNNFKKSIPKEETKLIVAFENNLKTTVKNYESELEKGEFELVKYVLRNREQYLESLPDLDSKKRMIMHDDNFEELRLMSIQIFEKAINILKENDKKDNENIENQINKMKEIIDKVEPYNIEEAKIFLSEAILDAEFIKDRNIGIYSFRLSREIQYIKEEEER